MNHWIYEPFVYPTTAISWGSELA